MRTVERSGCNRIMTFGGGFLGGSTANDSATVTASTGSLRLSSTRCRCCHLDESGTAAAVSSDECLRSK
jgi:hypothetical protein